MKVADKDSRLFKALSTLVKTYNSDWNPVDFAAPGDATPSASTNDLYFPTENGTIFGLSISDFKKQVIVKSITAYAVENIDGFESKTNVFNVTNKVPLSSGYYTLYTAKNAVPQKVRKQGLIILYQTESRWEMAQFNSSNIAEWGDIAPWTNLTYDSNVKWKGTKELTRLQIYSSDRKQGYLLSYADGDGNLILERYTTTFYADSEWQLDARWETIKANDALKSEIVGDFFTVIGKYLSRTTGLEVSDANFKVTPFLPLPTRGRLVVECYGLSAVSPLSFYDDNGVFIESIPETGETIKVITDIDYPSGAVFFRATSRANVESSIWGQTIESLLRLVNRNKELNDSAFIEINESIDTINNSLSEKVYTLLETTEALGSYVNNISGAILSNISYARTDYIPIDQAKRYAFTSYILVSNIGGVTFFDSSYAFIKAIGNTVGDHINEEITDLIPQNAAFAIVTSHNNLYSYGLHQISEVSNFQTINNFVGQYQEVKYENTNNVLSENGAILLNGDITSSAVNYRRNQTGIANPIVLEEGVDYYYSGEINNNLYAGCLFYTESGTRISFTTITEVKVHEKTKIEIPNRAKYMICCSCIDNADTIDINIYKGLSQDISTDLINNQVIRYNRISDITNPVNPYERKGVAVVGNFIIGLHNQKVVNDRMINAFPRQISEQNIGDVFIYDRDDVTGTWLVISSNSTLLQTTTDFNTFQNIGVFAGSILSARFASDGKILVWIATNGATIGGCYKGENNDFALIQQFGTNTANVVDHWSISIVGKVVLFSEYDPSINTNRQTTKAYISYDYGDSFVQIFDFHTSEFYIDVTTDDPDSLAAGHIHGCCYDQFENRAWLVTGDKLLKWVIYSDPIDDVNLVTWKGMYMEGTQFCPAFATKNGIIAGTDSNENAMFIIHRHYEQQQYPAYDLNHEEVHPILEDNTPLGIKYVPGRITPIGGIIYTPCNSWGPSWKNKVIATLNGLEYVTIWESKEAPNTNPNCKVFNDGDSIWIFDKSVSTQNKLHKLLKPSII